MDNVLDIGVSIPARNSDFMDLIMDSGIDDNGVARGVVVVSIFAICAVVMILRQDKD